jgi:hypothetical protein
MTDITTISKNFTETEKKLIIDTLKENDDYIRNYSQHKKNCIYILFAEWHKLFPAQKQDINCSSCRNAVVKFFKTMHIEWDTEVKTPKKKTSAKKKRK